jgi:hypothetical protein
MDKKDKIRFGQYIRTQLRESDILIKLFNTNQPTATDIQKQLDKRQKLGTLPKAEIADAKTVSNLLREKTETSLEYVLNFTASFFGVKPCDIDVFNTLWRNGEISEKDLYYQESIIDLQKKEDSRISKFIETHSEIERRCLSGFVGRQFVFDKINDFIGSNDRGYFRIIGDPGIGKTTLATKYAKDNNCILHIINAGKDGTGTAKRFLQNVCAQIILKRNLIDFEDIPNDIEKDSSFIDRVLQSASENIKKDEKIIIVVDGLDEVIDLTFYRNRNILFLPRFLPPNIYFILTMRKIEDQIQLPNEELNGRFEISNESKENLADTEEYIRNEIEQEGIQRYLHKQAMGKEEFIETLIGKSDGNFMYLKYVIPEIASGNYKDATLSTLPQGLDGYYRDHWNRMMAVPEEVKNIKLKTIYVLSEMNNPVSTTFLSDIVKSNIEGVEAVQIQKILNEWMQFLHIRKGQEGEQKYSFYHKSFLDFLRSNEMIKAAGFDLSDVNEIIADYMTKGLFE